LIGLDTNLLVRYFTQDDLRQSQQVKQFINSLTPENPGFVTLVTMVELCWVLTGKVYHYNREEFFSVVHTLLKSDQLVVERTELIMEAAQMAFALRADFADSLIQCASLNAGSSAVFTFDEKAARLAGMTLLV
jgi:predicted nucleic-acid-binding protein